MKTNLKCTSYSIVFNVPLLQITLLTLRIIQTFGCYLSEVNSDSASPTQAGTQVKDCVQRRAQQCGLGFTQTPSHSTGRWTSHGTHAYDMQCSRLHLQHPHGGRAISDARVYEAAHPAGPPTHCSRASSEGGQGHHQGGQEAKASSTGGDE